jgi:hypothetical protein
MFKTSEFVEEAKKHCDVVKHIRCDAEVKEGDIVLDYNQCKSTFDVEFRLAIAGKAQCIMTTVERMKRKGLSIRDLIDLLKVQSEQDEVKNEPT